MCAYSSDLVRTKNWTTETLKDTDLEGQFDLIIAWVMALANETTGHKHDATENEGPKLVLTAAAAVSGVLPVANGGTGQSTLATLLNLVYPVGSEYTNHAVSTNPATLLGFGTWVALEETVTVGYKSGGTFDPLGDTGGAETVAHVHSTSDNTEVTDVGWDGDGAGSKNYTATDHNHGNTGSTSPSVLQPYVVAYKWKRTV